MRGIYRGKFCTHISPEISRDKIVGIDDFSTGRRDALDSGIVFYEGSVCDEKLLNTIFKKHAPEYVFHFAAMPRVSYSVEHPAKQRT